MSAQPRRLWSPKPSAAPSGAAAGAAPPAPPVPSADLADVHRKLDALAADLAAARRDLRALAEAVVRLARGPAGEPRRDALDPSNWVSVPPPVTADGSTPFPFGRSSRLELD